MIEEGERLLEIISEVRRANWYTQLNNMDIKRNSSKAWGIFKKLDCNPTKLNTRTSIVTVNEVAHQLFINGRTKKYQLKHR